MAHINTKIKMTNVYIITFSTMGLREEEGIRYNLKEILQMQFRIEEDE